MTKALIRNEGETVTEDCGLSFIDWKTGAPLTNGGWFGGPYILVNDYVSDDPANDFVQAPPAQAPAADGATYGCTNPSAASQPAGPTPAAAPAQDPPADTIVIDGVKYIRTS